MKKGVITAILFVVLSVCNAQIIDRTLEPGYHQHKGFFLSMSIGPNFPSISSEVPGSYDMTFKGTGAQFDFKIGGALKENVILHFTATSNTISGPKVISGTQSQNASNDITLGEGMLGAGFTYYFMPSNIFVSGTLGRGKYTVIDKSNNTNISSDRGFSMQLKVGKEWWVSKNWGLGIGFTYGKTKLINNASGAVAEYMDSNNFGILFNTTLN